MAIKFNRSQTFATGGTVTSAALHNLVDGTDIYAALITDQANLSTVSTADKLLIADTDDSVNAKSVTVQELFDDALTAGTFSGANISNNLTYGTATGNRTVSTSATITTGTINNATLGTTTGTAATFTSGTLTSGVIPTATLGTTTGTAATFTSGTIATGLIPTLTAGTTTGTIATFSGDLTIGDKIVHSGDTNTAIRFPSADTVSIETNGTEALRVTSSQAISIGTTTTRAPVEVSGYVASSGTLGGFQIFDRATNVNSSILYSPTAGDLRVFDAVVTTDRFAFTSTGDCLATSAGRIGYGSGSGGTVTQGTSKTTGVTLNKPTGQITMHNAALANGASVNFALTNSFISAVDTLLVNATSFGGYTVLCVNTATGAATIRVTNISGGSLSEAVTIQFAVIKGATA